MGVECQKVDSTPIFCPFSALFLPKKQANGRETAVLLSRAHKIAQNVGTAVMQRMYRSDVTSVYLLFIAYRAAVCLQICSEKI